MQSSASNANMASSPLSDDISHHETPATNLTALSAPSTNARTASRPKFGLSFHAASTSTSGNEQDDDVFLNAPTPTAAQSHLSPTAETFAPKSAASVITTSARSSSNPMTGSTATTYRFTPNTTESVLGFPHLGPGSANLQPPFGVGDLLNGSAPEDDDHHLMNVQSGCVPFGAVGQDVLRGGFHPQINISPLPPQQSPLCPLRLAVVHLGIFSTDENATRALSVKNVAAHNGLTMVASVFEGYDFSSLREINAKKLGSDGIVVVAFSDIREQQKAVKAIKATNPTYEVTQLSARDLALHHGNGDVDQVTNFEGQLLITLYFNDTDPKIPVLAGPVLSMLQHSLELFGNVKAVHSLPGTQQHMRLFRVEYYSTTSAQNAFGTLQQFIISESMMVSAEMYHPDVTARLQPPSSALVHTPPNHLSITGRTTVSTGYDYRTQQILSDLSHEERSNRRPFYGNHNQISIPRIQNGQDVRTTVMLRNIPNKVNQAEMKSVLDETSRGQYDFMYLRIDFANNCNVGYCFINFVDPVAIIPFAENVAHRRWIRFDSDKVAELSYATIQGKDCLVQKFRNSSVMLEDPSFRPKLFLTGNGPDAGQEEQFPGPDNMSKMRRSLENAETVGLYRPIRSHHGVAMPVARALYPSTASPQPPAYDRVVPVASPLQLGSLSPHDPFSGPTSSPINSLFAPRQGQAYREEQRRRRSQFDRGTPGAEMELNFDNFNLGARRQDPALSPGRRTSNGGFGGSPMFSGYSPSLWSPHGF